MLPDDSRAAPDHDATMNPPLPTIPGYRLQRRLGEGGMAVVYLAVQYSLDREVAIKIITPAASSDEAQTRRFEHEARIIAKLEHPGIVGIHEVGRTAEGQLYYVMPYLARGDLSQRDYREHEAGIVDLLRALLGALGYAHARGIVHRDVKAENVLFNNADRPQLTDFGIALTRGRSNARITGAGIAVGSGGYMSPEQARGEPVDGRADLYSLGVLTYELLTGALPYDGDDPLALALLHATAPVPSLPAHRAHWQGFIDTAMAKSPDKRFRNAQVMARALEPIAEHLQLPQPSGLITALSGARRPVVLVAIGAGASLALGLLLVPLWREYRLASPPAADDIALTIPPEAVAPTAQERGEQMASLLQQAETRMAAGDLITPAGANAAEFFLAILRVDPTHIEAREGLDRVLARLGERVVASIAQGEDESVRQRYEEARLLAESAQLQATPAWTAVRDQVRSALRQRADAAARAADRDAVLRWTRLAQQSGLEDEHGRALRARALQDASR
ncbi:MAG: serine/threonine protein kinase [Chiayiivirga sp.]|jgi:serine/threonine-protein kinase PpkA|nr:serine/threonine protein kinase [Chiayiivirga sp.]